MQIFVFAQQRSNLVSQLPIFVQQLAFQPADKEGEDKVEHPYVRIYLLGQLHLVIHPLLVQLRG